jgi:hypothetical protein
MPSSSQSSRFYHPHDVATRNIRYLKFHGGRLDDWSLKLRQHFITSNTQFQLFWAHHDLYCRISSAVALRGTVV